MVSVVIPVYKGELIVRRAVESALAQMETGEVVLAEDGSPDGSLAVCLELASQYPKVRVFRHPDGKNHGISATRNLGITNSLEEFIAFLDNDDYYLPGRFKISHEILSNNPDVDGVYEATKCDFQKEEYRQQWIAAKKATVLTFKEGIPPESLLKEFLTGRGMFHTNSVTVRKTLFKKTGIFDLGLRISEDSSMWIRMAAIGKLVAGSIKEPVAVLSVYQRSAATSYHHFSKAEWDKAHCAMSKAVFAWAIKAGLDTDKRRLILDRLVASELSAYAGNPVGIRQAKGMLHMLNYIGHNNHLFSLSDASFAIICRSGIVGLFDKLSPKALGGRPREPLAEEPARWSQFRPGAYHPDTLQPAKGD